MGQVSALGGQLSVGDRTINITIPRSDFESKVILAVMEMREWAEVDAIDKTLQAYGVDFDPDLAAATLATLESPDEYGEFLGKLVASNFNKHYLVRAAMYQISHSPYATANMAIAMYVLEKYFGIQGVHYVH